MRSRFKALGLPRIYIGGVRKAKEKGNWPMAHINSHDRCSFRYTVRSGSRLDGRKGSDPERSDVSRRVADLFLHICVVEQSITAQSTFAVRRAVGLGDCVQDVLILQSCRSRV